MKKKAVICAIIISIIVVSVLVLTNGFTKGVITGKLYRVDNVYEEIWNMVNSEKNGRHTILTTAIEDAYVDYDFGLFQQVYIPVNGEYSVSLTLSGDALVICIFEKNSNYGDSAHYVYNYKSNTLYGNREESYLVEKFTSLYDSWLENTGKFHLENQGDYTYVFEEYPWTME